MLPWIFCKRDEFPHIARLSQCVFSTPGSQIDNGRVFSSAGVISGNRRYRVSVENMDRIMHVYHNHPSKYTSQLNYVREEDQEFTSLISQFVDAEIELQSELTNEQLDVPMQSRMASSIDTKIFR